MDTGGDFGAGYTPREHIRRLNWPMVLQPLRACWAGVRASGQLTRIIGRGGSGPGEFQTSTLVQTFAADSLLVWDAALRRLSFLSATTGEPTG